MVVPISPAARTSSSSLWNCGPGLNSSGWKRASALGGADPPGEADRLGGDPPVGFGREVVRPDRGRRARLRAPDPDVAAALRAQIADRGGERREGMQRLAEARRARAAGHGIRDPASRAPDRICANAPSWMGAIVSGPRRNRKYSTPIQPRAEQAVRLLVQRAGALHPVDRGAAAGGPGGCRRRPRSSCTRRDAELLQQLARSPTPESCRSCGEPIAPAARISSPLTAAEASLPCQRKCDARGAAALERDPRRLARRVSTSQVRAGAHRPQERLRPCSSARPASG